MDYLKLYTLSIGTLIDKHSITHLIWIVLYSNMIAAGNTNTSAAKQKRIWIEKQHGSECRKNEN